MSALPPALVDAARRAARRIRPDVDTVRITIAPHEDEVLWGAGPLPLRAELLRAGTSDTPAFLMSDLPWRLGLRDDLRNTDIDVSGLAEAADARTALMRAQGARRADGSTQAFTARDMLALELGAMMDAAMPIITARALAIVTTFRRQHPGRLTVDDAEILTRRDLRRTVYVALEGVSGSEFYEDTAVIIPLEPA